MPLSIERNDLAHIAADAIVIAANEYLKITGGVGQTVAQEAGLAQLQSACDEIGHCPCGSAVITPGFDLDAYYIIHAVGPIWQGGDHGEIELLRSAYDSALACAADAGARSIALPLLSAGTYGFPADISLAVARESIRSFLNSHDIDIRLVLYSRKAVAAGIDAYLDIVEYIDDHYVDSHFYEGTYIHPDEPINFNPPSYAPPPERLMGAAPRSSEKRKGLREFFKRKDKRKSDTGTADMQASADTAAVAAPARSVAPSSAPQKTMGLEEMLASLDAPFSITLLELIDSRGMTDAQVYKRANMSRQLFSKIRSDADYRPTKKTVLALSIALELSIEETCDLLARAGYALSNSSKADVIVEYFIRSGNYDIFAINEALYAFDQPLL